MILFTQHPDLDPKLTHEFMNKHLDVFEAAELIALNNEQVVKSFSLDGEDFVIKRYLEKSPRAKLRSLLGISRAMNSFKRSAQLSKLGIQTPAHLFLAQHHSILRGSSYLIMRHSKGTMLHSIIHTKPEAPIPNRVIDNLAMTTNRLHAAGLSHGDLHAGNIFVLEDESIEVIDLDNVRPNRKKQKWDRARLLRSFKSRPALQEKLAHSIAPAS